MTRKRSKVRSKTRSNSSQKSEDELVYCICRTSDGTRFMIACDNCEEWYHGDCINVTPKQANNIRRFFCHLCIGRNPSLEIEYKTSKDTRPRLPNLRQQIKRTTLSSEDDENDEAELSSSSSPGKSSTKSRRAVRKRWRPPMAESVVTKRRRGRPRERQEDYDEEATEDEVETSGLATVAEVDDVSFGVTATVGRGRGARDERRAQPPARAPHRSIGLNNRKFCGVCRPCRTIKDCGLCEVCLRFSQSTLPKSICRKRRCVQSEYRIQSRKSYQGSKEYNKIDDFGGVLEEPDYHRHGNMRRRSEFEIGEIRQCLTNPLTSNKETCAIGSKMRRGDHLPGGGNSTSRRRGLTNVDMPYKSYGEESAGVVNGLSCRYQQGHTSRLSRNQSSRPQHLRRFRKQSDAAQMSSNTSSVSGRMSSHHQYPYVDDSDEDVMIPGEMITPRNGQRISDSDVRTFYGLDYPDHLYCKHHRSFNWHASLQTDTPTEAVGPESLLPSSEADVPGPKLRSPLRDETLPFVGAQRLARARLAANEGRLKSSKSVVPPTSERLEADDSVYAATEQCYQAVDLNRAASKDGKPRKSPPGQRSASVFAKTSLANVQAQEFYTINDEDDLEINWPKETVNV